MEINEEDVKRAATTHARTVLGEAQFQRNKDAVKSIAMDFVTGVRWLAQQIKEGGNIEKI